MSNYRYRNQDYHDRYSKHRDPISYIVNGGKTEIRILQGDITKTKVDAIVNAANEHMTGGAGVDGIIHHAAGPQLVEECYRHREVSKHVRLPTGHSRILLSYNLSKYTHYIINTAGPIYSHYHREQCEDELASCYRTSLALANLYDLESIAFPAISCGIFGYPADNGAETSITMVDKHAGDLKLVIFVLFDDHIYDAWFDKAKEMKLEKKGDPKTPNKSRENESENSDQHRQPPQNDDAGFVDAIDNLQVADRAARADGSTEPKSAHDNNAGHTDSNPAEKPKASQDDKAGHADSNPAAQSKAQEEKKAYTTDPNSRTDEENKEKKRTDSDDINDNHDQ